jgi:hypothetical protein
MPVHAKGLCYGHYKRERRASGLRPLKRRPEMGEQLQDRPGARSLWDQLVDAAIDLADANDTDAAAWTKAKTRLRVAALRYVRAK